MIGREEHRYCVIQEKKEKELILGHTFESLDLVEVITSLQVKASKLSHSSIFLILLNLK